MDLSDIVREAKRSNARRGDFNSRSNRGRDSFRGRGDFRLEPSYLYCILEYSMEEELFECMNGFLYCER